MATNAQGRALASDLTAKTRETQVAAAKAEQTKAAEQMSLATAQAANEFDNVILDVTQRPEIPTVINTVEDLTVEVPTPVAAPPAAVVVDEITVVKSDDDTEVIRVNEDLQEVTIGDRVYNFVAGKQYRVPRNVAFHLREKDRVWR